MKVYHGSNVKIEIPNAEFGRKNLDFGPGFYVTEMKEQAVRQSFRVSNKVELPVLNIYEFDQDEALYLFCEKFKNFDSYFMTAEIAKFIINNRKGGDAHKQYQIIKEPMADGIKIQQIIIDYLEEQWDDKKLVEKMGFGKRTDQISFKSEALSCLYFVDVIYPEVDDYDWLPEWYKEVWYAKLQHEKP